MDNLTATAIAAGKAGMSYGQYVALHGIRCVEKPIVADVPTKICPECGKAFPRVGRRSHAVYCDPECQRIHNEKLALQRYHERKNSVKP